MWKDYVSLDLQIMNTTPSCLTSIWKVRVLLINKGGDDEYKTKRNLKPLKSSVQHEKHHSILIDVFIEWENANLEKLMRFVYQGNSKCIK